MISVIIGGDVCPGSRSTPFLVRGDAKPVFGDFAQMFSDADLVIANLEGPLIKTRSPIAKIGPHHGFDENCIHGLKAAGFHLLNLGNNHTMDHDWAGLQNTIRLCESNGIAHVGAGENLARAARPWTTEVNGLRLGVLSLTEHEFGLARTAAPGTNPLNTIDFVRTVQAHKSEWDFLIVLLHAGNEYYPYPRPSLQKLCRFMIEQGAGAVICQHSHCAGSHETYRGGYIIYGQGNFLCDDPSRSCEEDGVLVTLRIEPGGTVAAELTPFMQVADRPGPVLMDAPRRERFLSEFNRRSVALQDDAFVEREWQEFCVRGPYHYLGLLHGYPKRVRELDQKFGFLKRVYSRKRQQMLLHLLRCESHHEALMGALNRTLAGGAAENSDRQRFGNL